MEPLSHKVYAVVNCDGFKLDRDAEVAYLDAVKDVGDRYFHGVTWFTTSTFMRAKLGDSLSEGGVAPHVYKSGEKAKGIFKEKNTNT